MMHHDASLQDSAGESDADSVPAALPELFAVAEREQRADSATRIGTGSMHGAHGIWMGFDASTMGD